MTNYRLIFNQNYSVLLLITIIIIFLLILLLEKNIKKSFHNIGKTLITGGFTSLVLLLIIKLIIPNQYQIVLNIITSSILKNTLTYSTITIAIGLLLLVISKIINIKVESNQK